MLRALLARHIYCGEMTWDSQKNWRSRKVRLPLALQEVIIEVAKPVLQKNKASLKDFISRLQKRMSSTNKPGTKDAPEGQSVSHKKDRERTETLEDDSDNASLSNPVSPTMPCSLPMDTGNADSVRHKHGSDTRVRQNLDEEESDNSVLPPAKKVRTPGAQDTHYNHDEPETEERKKARQSVLAYQRRQREKQRQDEEGNSSFNVSDEDLEFSSDEY